MGILIVINLSGSYVSFMKLEREENRRKTASIRILDSLNGEIELDA
jgi:hypothetical protein